MSLTKWAKKPDDYTMLQSEAKTIFRQWSARISEGRERPTTSGLTFDTLAQRYLDEFVYQPDRRPRAAAEMGRLVRAVRDAEIEAPAGGRARFGSLPATGITKAHIEAFRVSRRSATGAKCGRVATNRMLSRLRHLFNWAIGEKGLLETTPFVKGGVSVIKLDGKVEGPRSRRLEGDEEPRLLAAAGDHLRACIEMALETGMRVSEILGLRWEHIRSARGLIELPSTITKNERRRYAILTPRVAATLEMPAALMRAARELPADVALPDHLHIFGNDIGEPISSFKTAWGNACRRAGISGLHFHDLRREAGSTLLEADGVTLADVQLFLGHRTVTQTATYLSSSTSRLREAVAKRDAARTSLAHPPEDTDTAPAGEAVTH